MKSNSFNFQELDFLHSPIPMSYKNYSSFRTVIGAILSLFITITIITCSILKFKTLINKTSFTLTSNEIQNSNGLINFSNTPILFTLYDDKGNNYEDDPKLYNFSVVQIDQIYNKDGTKKHIIRQIELERCDHLIKSFDLLNYFSDYNLTQYTCIKPGQNLTTYGVLGDTYNNYGGIRIYMNKCNNKTNICYNESIVERELKKKLLFTVLFLGYNTDFISTDKNKNIEYQIYSNFVSVSPYLVKKVYMNFILGKYYLYDNIFYNSKKIYTYFMNGERYHDMSGKSEEKQRDIIAYFSFNYQGYSIEHTKKVEKITDTISYICYIFNIIYTIAKMINNYFSKKILFVDIYNMFFILIPRIGKSKPRVMKLNDSVNELNSNQNYLDNNMISFGNKKKKTKNSQNIKTISMSPVKINKLIKTKRDFLKYYLCPMCLWKNKKQSIINIHRQICQYFSLEKFSELVRKYKNLSYEIVEKLINDKVENINLSSISNRQFVSKDKLKNQIFIKANEKNI